VEDQHYWPLHRCEVIRAELEAFAPSKACGRLVELGTGIGTVATHLNGAGYKVDYGDFFENALEIARMRAERRLGAAAHDRRFMRVDLTEPLAVGEYAGMLLLDVIEHLPDTEVLAHVRAALPPGGFVVITVPAFSFLWSPWDDVEKHKRRYTRSGLEAVLEQSGFKVVRSTYFFAPLFFAALSMKGVRLAKNAVFGRPNVGHATELTEMVNVSALNRLMLGVLAPEKALLRRGRLPFGTSILAIARVA
jgi:SAM-dependent methyltransferase